MVKKIALVRTPSSRLGRGFSTDRGFGTDIDAAGVNSRKARNQWRHYVGVLEDHDWQVTHLPAADESPDGVFVGDTVVLMNDLAVIARPGAVVRRPETVGAEPIVIELGLSVGRIQPSGTLDGGDVFAVGGVVYVGSGGGTNPSGVAQLRAMLQPLGGVVETIPMRSSLHLNSAITALADGTIIGYKPIIEDRSVFPHLIEVPEESGAHLVDLGGGRLLMAANCPLTARMLQGLGYDPIIVDISELQKVRGCVSSLSARRTELTPAFAAASA